MENGQEVIKTECNNCLCEFDLDDATTCEDCGATLCPECICEDCENKK